MIAIIGIVAVIGAILAGYLLEHGNLAVLVQPAELIIIGGAAVGTLLIANPLPVIIKIFKAILGVLSSNKYNKDRYLKTLKMLNDLFKKGRKGGVSALESDIEEPENSELFKLYPEVLEGSSCRRVHLRHDSHWHERHNFAFRSRPDDRA